MDNKKQPSKAYSYLMMAGHICCDMNMAALPALLPFLVVYRGIDYASAAGLIFASSFLSSLIQPLLGMIADRRQMPWLMGTGMLMAGLGIAAIGVLDNYWSIFAVVMFAGFGSALFHPEGGRMANCVAGEKKGGSMSNFAAGGSLGFVIGPIVIAFAVSAWGLRGTLVLLVPTLIMVAIFFGMQKQFRQLSSMSQREVRKEMDASGQRDDWPSLLKLCVSIFSRSIVLQGMITFIPLYWVSVLMQTHQQGSLMITFMALAAAASAFLGGRIADRFGFSLVIRIACASALPLIILIPAISSVWLAAMVVVPIVALLNLGNGPSVVLGQKYLPNRLGMASGITLGLSVSVGGLSSPILGRIGDNHGLVTVLYVLAGVALLGALGTLLIKDPAASAKTSEALSQ